jgi:ribosomal protein L37AE/L43A
MENDLRQDIIKSLEDKRRCSKCNNEDVYKINCGLYNYRCNTCGEVFD